MRARVDDFTGSDEQYISYLEREVLALRGRKAASNSTSSSCEPHLDVAEDSACDLSNAASTQHNGKRLKRHRELEFIMLDPGSLSHNPVKQYIPNPRWRDNANTLIAETPKAVDWYSSLKQQGIYDILSNGQAVAYLMAVDDRSPVLPSEPASLGFSISDRLKGYALAATHRGSAASIALKLANFQKFLVLSACCVLRQSSEQDCILEVISLCVGRSVTPRRGEDLLNTCRFVNRLMDALYVHGWGLRGCELFLLCESNIARNNSGLTFCQGTDNRVFSIIFAMQRKTAFDCSRLPSAHESSRMFPRHLSNGRRSSYPSSWTVSSGAAFRELCRDTD